MTDAMTEDLDEKAAFLKVELPDSLRPLVEEHLGKEDDLLVSMLADMHLNGDYKETWLVMDKEQIATIVVDNGSTSLGCIHDLKDVTDVVVAAGVGNSVLEIEKDEQRYRVIRFSNAIRAEFSEAARLIKDWAKDGKWDIESANVKRSVCPRCHRPVPDDTGMCPSCIEKGNLLKRSLSYLLPYKSLVAGMVLCMVLSSVVGLISPLIGRYLIDEVLMPPLKNAYLLAPLALAMLATYVGQTMIEIVSRHFAAKVGTRAVYDVRGAMFRKLQELSLSFYAKRQTGSIITRVNHDSERLHNLMVDFIPFGISMILTAVGVLAMLLYLSWYLTLFIMIPIAVMIFFINRVFPTFHRYWRRFFERRSKFAAYVTDVVTGARVVKAFAQERAEISRFDEKSDAYRQALYEAELKMARTIPMLHVIAMSGTPIVWLVGGLMVFKGTMTLGGIVAYSGYVMMMFRPIFILSRLAELIPSALAAAGRVFDIIDTEPEIRDAPDAVPMPNMKGRIEIKNISFGYESHKTILEDVSIDIGEKEMIGLVGHSGAGKTTLMNLICRFYDVKKGQILIDGVDIKKIRYADLRAQLGIVLQETFLLSGTIADNIAYARPGADISAVIAAARTANAHDFIVKKPDGYDTMVEEGGKNLSAGEKQRIAIARAVLCDPQILLLDEATSSVDVETEKQIQEALERLTSKRTTISIAHRLSTLKKADRLLVLEKGKVVETGTHEELLAMEDGVYKKMAVLHSELSQVRAVDG